MASPATLKASRANLTSISQYWRKVISNPNLRAIQDKHQRLKGDEHEGCGHDHHHHHHDHDHSLVDHVIHDLDKLRGEKSHIELGPGKEGFLQQARAAEADNIEITPEMAQTLHFIQQFVKTEIKALEKDTTWGVNTQTLKYAKDATVGRILGKGKPDWQGFSDQVKQDRINHLKGELAKIEAIAPIAEIERLSKEARIAQRRDDNEWKRADGFRNWLDGTLSEDQTAVLKALQWETASGSFRPDKIIGGFLEHFAEGHLSTWGQRAVTTGITYLVVDAINFMTSVTGAHQLFSDESLSADQKRDATVSTEGHANIDPFANIGSTAGESTIQNTAASVEESLNSIAQRLDEQCLEKFDPSYPSVIDSTVENVFPGSCHEISQGLQTLFEVKTVTPRTLQSAQESWADYIMTEGSLAAEQYDRHHASASEMIANLAFYDNSLHWFLLLVGGATGAKTILEYGNQEGFKKIGSDLKQKGALIKERPLPLGMAAAAGASQSLHSGLTQGDFVNMGMLPYVLFGAMAGVIAQRLKIHHSKNKAAIFNLHADIEPSHETHIPATSLDNERRYALKVAGIVTAIYAGLITLNNTGKINHQSPELIQEAMNAAMWLKAYAGGSVSWAVFDRLDDIAYHVAFYEGGIGTGALATTSVLAAAHGASKLSAAPYDYKTAWKMAVEKGKEKLRPLALATGLSAAEPDKSYERRFDLWDRPPEREYVDHTWNTNTETPQAIWDMAAE